ncbi:hypothetical protein PVAP13_7NG198917 [Panicum virgatum]|uniref:Uncharacterized protein n=1 Tax=Panicum virgatum TaxID=38727 RepID=A0A8T0PZH4_PANVG|nr:hypothetical protein PVAP13_7NG198917 [Panicum virgatum]
MSGGRIPHPHRTIRMRAAGILDPGGSSTAGGGALSWAARRRADGRFPGRLDDGQRGASLGGSSAGRWVPPWLARRRAEGRLPGRLERRRDTRWRSARAFCGGGQGTSPRKCARKGGANTGWDRGRIAGAREREKRLCWKPSV